MKQSSFTWRLSLFVSHDIHNRVISNLIFEEQDRSERLQIPDRAELETSCRSRDGELANSFTRVITLKSNSGGGTCTLFDEFLLYLSASILYLLLRYDIICLTAVQIRG